MLAVGLCCCTMTLSDVIECLHYDSLCSQGLPNVVADGHGRGQVRHAQSQLALPRRRLQLEALQYRTSGVCRVP